MKSCMLDSFLVRIAQKNMPASIGEEQFCHGWWCGCYHQRVPYVSGIKWHASRFDYVLLLPSRQRRSEQACDIHWSKTKTKTENTKKKKKKEKKQNEIIILFVQGARARKTVSAILSVSSALRRLQLSRGYRHVLSSWWQWEKLNRTNEQASERANERTKWRMTFGHLCLFKMIRPLVTVTIVAPEDFHASLSRCLSFSLTHWLTYSVYSMHELLPSLLV